MQIFLLLITLIMMAGCDTQSHGFNLPPGDPEQGRATFILMQCNDCHTVEGVPWAGGEAADDEGAINVFLGGQTPHVKTYGDLVTSIIHPSHKLSRGQSPGTVTETGESTMRNYNDVMTVQELIDLVAFLQSKYEIWVPDYYTYRR